MIVYIICGGESLMIAYICGLVKSKSKLLNLIGLLPLIYLLYKNQYMLLAPWYGWRNIFGFLLLYLIIYNAIKENTREYILNSFLLISIALALVAGADSGLKNVVIIFETFSPVLLIEHKRLFGLTYFKKVSSFIRLSTRVSFIMPSSPFQGHRLGLLTTSSPLMYVSKENIDVSEEMACISSNNIPVVKLYDRLGFHLNEQHYVFVKHQ